MDSDVTAPPTLEIWLDDDLKLTAGVSRVESMSSHFLALCSSQDMKPSHQQEVRLGYKWRKDDEFGFEYAELEVFLKLPAVRNTN